MTPDERLQAIFEELSLMLHLGRDNDEYLGQNLDKINTTLTWLNTHCDPAELVRFVRNANLCEEEVILDLLSEPYFQVQ